MKKIIGFLLVLLTIFPVVAAGGCSDNPKISSYNIEATFDGNTLNGKESVTFYNNTDNAFKELKFNLFGNAYRENAKYTPISAQYENKAYYKGKSYGKTEILSVKKGGNDSEFEICGKDENILSVKLPEEVFPDESVTVEIEFSLRLAEVIARTGINADTINLANFYPILCGIENESFFECEYYGIGDPFYSDVANYKVKITLPKKYNVASAGKLTGASESEETRTLCYKLDNARSFNMVLSEKFESVTASVNGITVNYWYYKDEKPEKTLEYATKSLEFFGETFGEYPYSEYTVAQTKLIAGGMEYPTFVTISDTLTEKERGEVTVHETAHQWWQSVVGNNEIKHGFLDEGLAEYSVVLFYENFPEYGMKREDMILSAETTYKTFCTVYDKLFNNVNTCMDRTLGEFTSEYEYVNLSYIKPCIMYDLLRKTLGDNKFFGGLKKYYSEYKFKNAEPCDLVGVYQKIGANAEGFLQSFIDGKEIL